GVSVDPEDPYTQRLSMFSGRSLQNRRNIRIFVEYIRRIILPLQFAQTTVIFRAVCRRYAVSLVSRNEIGVGAAGCIGLKRVAQSLGPSDMSARVQSMLPTRLDDETKPGVAAAVGGCALWYSAHCPFKMGNFDVGPR